jgi:hypothetical protein
MEQTINPTNNRADHLFQRRRRRWRFAALISYDSDHVSESAFDLAEEVRHQVSGRVDVRGFSHQEACISKERGGAGANEAPEAIVDATLPPVELEL